MCISNCPLYILLLCDCVLVRRERSKVPLIVRQCVEEIERRGMEEVGIYRVSGVATDIQALKAAFDSSECWEWRGDPHVHNTKDTAQNYWLKAYYSTRLQYYMVFSDCLLCCTDNRDVSVMMREMDVNAIAGTLKLYFRELPEPLFTDELYPNFAGGIGQLLVLYFPVILEDLRENKYSCKLGHQNNHVFFCFAALSDSVAKESCMLNLLLSLPETNLVTFLFLLDHLKR